MASHRTIHRAPCTPFPSMPRAPPPPRPAPRASAPPPPGPAPRLPSTSRWCCLKAASTAAPNVAPSRPCPAGTTNRSCPQPRTYSAYQVRPATCHPAEHEHGTQTTRHGAAVVGAFVRLGVAPHAVLFAWRCRGMHVCIHNNVHAWSWVLLLLSVGVATVVACRASRRLPRTCGGGAPAGLKTLACSPAQRGARGGGGGNGGGQRSGRGKGEEVCVLLQECVAAGEPLGPAPVPPQHTWRCAAPAAALLCEVQAGQPGDEGPAPLPLHLIDHPRPAAFRAYPSVSSSSSPRQTWTPHMPCLTIDWYQVVARI